MELTDDLEENSRDQSTIVLLCWRPLVYMMETLAPSLMGKHQRAVEESVLE